MIFTVFLGSASAEGNESVIIGDDLNPEGKVEDDFNGDLNPEDNAEDDFNYYDDTYYGNSTLIEENSTLVNPDGPIVIPPSIPDSPIVIPPSIPTPTHNQTDFPGYNTQSIQNPDSDDLKDYKDNSKLTCNDSNQEFNRDSKNKDHLIFKDKINDSFMTGCSNNFGAVNNFIKEDSTCEDGIVIKSAFSNDAVLDGSGTIIWVGESQYKRIDNLIRKYDKAYVPGELQASDRNKLLKRKQRKIEKHEICDDLLYECDFLKLSPHQKEFVHYLVDRFCDDFKSLHARAKKEAIILAFIFYVKKIDDSRIKVSNYSICKKYGLKEEVFLLIVCRMCDSFVKSSPIRYKESTRYDHDILSRNGGKIY